MQLLNIYKATKPVPRIEEPTYAIYSSILTNDFIYTNQVLFRRLFCLSNKVNII